MKKIEIREVVSILEEEFDLHQTPVVDLIEAQTKDPFKILIATILSARTKDETTAKVVRVLFEKVKKMCDFETYSEKEIETMIYPVGFFRQKAKYLKKLPTVINGKFDGKIPEDIDSLVKLPGVGRKTANLVRAVAFKKPAICVDIHVHRINNRLGYVNTKSPLETEMMLREKLPQDLWILYNRVFVSYGQNHCTPRNPKCNTCRIKKWCNQIDVISKNL